MDLLISVVIPTFNRARSLETCLSALETQRFDRRAFEILVIDDGSSDDTPRLLDDHSRKCSAKFRWLQQSHKGPAAARNLGLREALGSLIAFTDDDCVPTNEWLDALVQGLRDDATYAGIGGPIERIRDCLVSRYIDAAKLMAHWIEGDVVEYLITASALFRASCLREIGGFESSFPLAGGEDVDLSYRLRSSGYKLRITDSGMVRHHHPESLKGLYLMSWRHGHGAAFLARRGHTATQKTQLSSLGFRLIRTLTAPIPVGIRSGPERIAWRGLSLITDLGKFLGYRTGLRCGYEVT